MTVQDQRLDQLFAVGLRCGTQGGESQQSNNQLCGHGWRQQATTLVSGIPPGSASSKELRGPLLCKCGRGHADTQTNTLAKGAKYKAGASFT